MKAVPSNTEYFIGRIAASSEFRDAWAFIISEANNPNKGGMSLDTFRDRLALRLGLEDPK